MHKATPPEHNEFLTCTIDYVDNLGQGVDKKLDKITLIPKTLPGETVEIQVTGEQSKLRWGKLERITTPSPARLASPCKHFSQCPGCHYLHTSYEQEIELKKMHAEHLFKKYLTQVKLEFVAAPERLHYRNRIQLHYSKQQKKLGFIEGQSRQILEVPDCQITHPLLKQKLSELYVERNWMKVVNEEKESGHLELYVKNNSVHLNINRPYADGGFSQVNQAMNQILVEKITQAYAKFASTGPILDLFGGNGNLTMNLGTNQKILCVDYYQKLPAPVGPCTYFSLDMFRKDAFTIFQKQHPQAFSTIVVDPPRSGFKELAMWSDKIKPSSIIYVSCHPQTQVRDLEPLLGPYKIEQILVLDLFPGTFHFESMVVLSRT